jgi:hypothetical protein
MSKCKSLFSVQIHYKMPCKPKNLIGSVARFTWQRCKSPLLTHLQVTESIKTSEFHRNLQGQTAMQTHLCRFRILAAAGAATAILAGCGGGGDDEPQVAAPPVMHAAQGPAMTSPAPVEDQTDCKQNLRQGALQADTRWELKNNKQAKLLPRCMDARADNTPLVPDAKQAVPESEPMNRDNVFFSERGTHAGAFDTS